MFVNITQARSRLSELIRAVQAGEEVCITCRGKTAAQLTPAPSAEKRRKVVLGGMKGRILFRPGWDAPIDGDRFLKGDL